MNTAPDLTLPTGQWGGPEPHPGLREQDFKKICANGFGDGYNAYAYSMRWYRDHLYVGTARANLQLLKLAMPYVKMDIWPVETPHLNYTPEFENQAARGEIWRFHPPSGVWARVHHSPFVEDPKDGVQYSRDLGYRAMVEYQGKSDRQPVLYVPTWSRSRSDGPELLRSEDGTSFQTVPKPRFRTNIPDVVFTAIRAIVTFKGKLFTTPVGGSKGHVNGAGATLVYATDDPASGEWTCVNEPGFGLLPAVATVYDLCVVGDYLYAGTGGLGGFQIWRTAADGPVGPYQWEKVLENGAGRGALNQGAVSMFAFQDALYIGTGIQNGGYDWRFKVGPAAAEIIRFNPKDGSYDIIVGNARDGKTALSGLGAGFNNFFSGYLWRMGTYEGWLYAGTMDWSTILKFTNLKEKPSNAARLIATAGVEGFVKNHGGFELWRTCDGENWVPVTRKGFGNPYNYGCRNIVPTPYGLFIGTANPFGPRVATRQKGEWNWTYEDNPKGGLEVWQAAPKTV